MEDEQVDATHPAMLYKDGSDLDDHVVAQDADAEAAAAKDGYYRYGKAAAKPKAAAKKPEVNKAGKGKKRK